MIDDAPRRFDERVSIARRKFTTRIVSAAASIVCIGLSTVVCLAQQPQAARQTFGMRLREPPSAMSGVHAPTVVAPAPENESVLLRLPDDSLRIYYVTRPDGKSIRSRGSTDGGLTWEDDRHEFALPGSAYHAVQVFLDRNDEIHAVFHIFRGDGRRPGLDRNLDIWHCRTTRQRSQWESPQRIYEGYVGAIRGGMQMSSGRIIVPFAIAIPERWTAPPQGEPDYGWHNIIVMYSDDVGETWQRGPAELKVTLCGENVTRYGAIEPHVIELADGRVWMLIRDRCGRLYESDSTDGINWSDPQKTRFVSSDSPATTVRLRDGRIVLFWCADQRWDNPRSYAMGGREALHAAITADEGETWLGFREVLTEPLPPVERGDRGTAYPSAVCNAQGKIVLASGQGTDRQSIVLFDPEWLRETTARDDFSSGLEQWTCYGARGPAVVTHPDQPARSALAIRKPDAEAPAGALWNFPAGAAGELKIRLRAANDFQGADLWLTDHFAVIDDRDAPDNAVFQIPITSSGSGQDAVVIEPGNWRELTLTWQNGRTPARISLGGRTVLTVAPQRDSETGINYLGVRSAAVATDEAGLLIESVHVNVTPPARRTNVTTSINELDVPDPSFEFEITKTIGPEDGGAVLAAGPAGAFDQDWVGCPTVVDAGDEYYMWYSSHFDVNAGPGGIGLATSHDGIHWTRRGQPVLTPAPAASGVFDAGQVMGPDVLSDGKRWWMWYTGMSRDRHASGFGYYRIGLAQSEDGIHWHRSAVGKPVIDLGSESGCDSVQAATPTVLSTENGFRMWYAAWSPDSNHTVATAFSRDGVHWVKEGNGRSVTGLNPSIAYGPMVCRIDDQYLLLYMALQVTRGLYAAISTDGRDWQMVNAGQSILSPGDANAFDSAIVGHPCVLVDGSKLRIWYTGYRRAENGPSGLRLSIGLAEGTWRRSM